MLSLEQYGSDVFHVGVSGAVRCVWCAQHCATCVLQCCSDMLSFPCSTAHWTRLHLDVLLASAARRADKSLFAAFHSRFLLQCMCFQSAQTARMCVLLLSQTSIFPPVMRCSMLKILMCSFDYLLAPLHVFRICTTVCFPSCVFHLLPTSLFSLAMEMLERINVFNHFLTYSIARVSIPHERLFSVFCKHHLFRLW